MVLEEAGRKEPRLKPMWLEGQLMKRKTVEKPGWRQLAPPRLRIADCGLRIDFGFLRFPILLLLLLSTTGWAQNDQPPPIIPSSGLTENDLQPIRNPEPAPQLITTPGYRLHEGDKIEVRFFYQPELDQQVVVKPDGTISLQLIGDVRAEGITVPELEKLLVQRYSRILVDPTISVILKEYVKPRIFVGGEVAKPGPYELRDGDMLAQALLLAGGFTPEAHRKMVIHARPVGEGQMRVTVVDATKLYSRNPDPDLNLALKDGDLIYVPESKLSRLGNILQMLHLQTFGLVIDPFRNRR
jgi:polysaccharide export outer membrane protein